MRATNAADHSPFGRRSSSLMLAARPLAVVLATLQCASAATIQATVIASGQQLTLAATMAKLAAPLSSLSSTSLSLMDGGSACGGSKALRGTAAASLALSTDMAAQPFALLASRGGDCTVQDKMKTAIATGASALIIVDTLTSAYTPRNNDTASSLKLTDPCLVSCSKGRGLVDPKSLGVAGVLEGILGACPGPAADTGKGCPTSLCAFSGRAEGGLREVCCVLNPPAQVAPTSSASSSAAAVASDVNAGDGVEAGASIDSASLDSVLPTLYLSMSTGMALTQACKGSASAVGAAATLQRGPCTVLLGDGVPPSRFDGSMFLTWGLATFTAALAAYLAAHAMSDRGSGGGGDDGSGEGKGDGSEAYDDASATIDQSTAFGFLVIASGGLLTLYFLIQAGFNIVLVLLNAMFVLASGSAAAQILVTPCIVALLPPTTPLGAMRVTIPFSAAEVTGLAEEMPLTHLVGGLLAFGASLSWFFLRGSPWIWLLQDVLSVMICVLFVRTIRLPSLKVGSIFLGLMFCYDIFMVFISCVLPPSRPRSEDLANWHPLALPPPLPLPSLPLRPLHSANPGASPYRHLTDTLPTPYRHPPPSAGPSSSESRSCSRWRWRGGRRRRWAPTARASAARARICPCSCSSRASP